MSKPLQPGRSDGLVHAHLIVSLALCAIVLTRFYWPAAHGLDVTGHQIGRDFINNWAGPRLAFGGRLATLFDLHGYVDAISGLFGQRLPFHNWGYPPFTLILFEPFSALPYFWALAAWTVVFFALFAWAATAFVKPEHRVYMLVALLCAPACIVNAVGGQNGFATAALFLGGILLMERRPILAGVLLGLLTAKPQLGLVLPLVLIGLRAWRTILAACVTTAVLVAVSVLVFGIEPWRQYLTATSAFQLSLLKDFHGFYPYMMASVLAQARTFGLSFGAAAVLQAAVSVPVALVAAWAATQTADVRQRAFVLASAAPLVTPYAFNSDLTALTVVLTWRMIESPPPAGSAKGILFRLAWLSPIVLMSLNMAGLGLAPLVLIAVFAVAVSEAVELRPVLRSSAAPA